MLNTRPMRSKRPARVLPALVLTSLLIAAAGCATSTVLRQTPRLGASTSVATSADVRLITSVPVTMSAGGDYVMATQITCAEPSPDVAKIVSEAFGTTTAFSGKGKVPNIPTDADLKMTLALSKSYAEGIAQMTERLATIQLLRDGLYRACEAYANGAISATTYSAMVSRYDKTMITLLMGELAAGNFGRSLAALGGTTKADATIDGTDSGATKTQATAGAADQSPGATPADSPAAANQPADTPKASTKTEANTSATAAGTIAGGAPKAASDIAADLVQMQANYLNDHNLDALKIACLDSFGREQLLLDNDGAPMIDGAMPRNVSERGTHWQGTVRAYRYNYTRALSVWCDELVETLENNTYDALHAAKGTGVKPALMELFMPEPHAFGPYFPAPAPAKPTTALKQAAKTGK